MTLEDGANIATVILALVAVLGVVYWVITVRQFRRNLALSRTSIIEAERASRVRAFREVFDTMEQCRDQRHLLEERIAADLTFDVMEAPDADKLDLDKLARSYDMLGLMVKHGVAPVEVVMDFYSRPLVRGWQYLEPMVADTRRKRSQPGHMWKFQVLAAGAREHRRIVYPDERSFDPPKEVAGEWETWKRAVGPTDAST
jgi:hypothetical protein